jgi:chitin disaccharide deacetylase
MRKLIINADDFGTSVHFNKAILELCVCREITSTSVMVSRLSKEQNNQVDLLLGYSDFISIGLHLVLNGGNIESDIENQFNKFVSVFSRKPTHIDIHKYPIRQDSYELVDAFCYDQQIATRNHGIHHKAKTTNGIVFFATHKSVSEIKTWINELVNDQVFEILFHPGYFDETIGSSLNRDREQDIANIKALNEYIKGIDLKKVSYQDL